MDDHSYVHRFSRSLSRLKAVQQSIHHESVLHPEIKDELHQVLLELENESIKLEKGYQNLAGVTKISAALNVSLHLETVLEQVLDIILQLTGAERGFLMLRDKRNELVTRIARQWEKDAVSPDEASVSRSVIDKVIDRREPVMTTNALEDPRFGNQESVILHNLRSILCVPLIIKDELVGVVYTDNRLQVGLFSEADRDLVMSFANQAAIALENARLYSSVEDSLEQVTRIKNLMDGVFSSISSSVFTLDRKGEITFCNRSACELLDLPEADILQSSFPHLLPSVHQHIVQQIREVQEMGRVIIGIEVQARLEKRGVVSLMIHLSPFHARELEGTGIAIVIEDITETRRLQGLSRLFEKMVSPEVIRQLNPDLLHLGGTTVPLTILFADLCGFTALGEQVPPEILIGLINTYLAAAANAILAEEGTIDKFMGDAVMAWYNAPLRHVDHALRAVRSALRLQQAVKQIHEQFPPAYRLPFNIGIHTGNAVVGLVGSERRMEFTAIGDNVNTAKRLQEAAGAGEIIISQSTYGLIRENILAEPVRSVSLHGKRDPIQCFKVLGLDTAQSSPGEVPIVSRLDPVTRPVDRKV